MRECRLIGLVLAAGLLAVPAAAQDPSPPARGYTLGQGLPLGTSGVRLGGYATAEFENPARQLATFVIDDVSLFLFGDLGTRLRFFVEAEEAHFWQVDSTGAVTASNNADLERLYLDYLHADLLGIRLGKFLTPIGTWNEIHPDPLTWTVTRPAASRATFPSFTTGIEAFGTWAGDRRDVDFNVFVQHNGALDNAADNRQTERMVGGRVRVRQDHFEVGIPIVRYTERESGDVVTFSGADILARAGRLEVRGEATAGRVRAPAGRSRPEYAAYLQAAAALTDRVFVVGRQEWARSRDNDHFTATSGALVVRPRPAMSAKIEFQARTGQFLPVETATGNRVLASFGVLF